MKLHILFCLFPDSEEFICRKGMNADMEKRLLDTVVGRRERVGQTEKRALTKMSFVKTNLDPLIYHLPPYKLG